MSARRGSISSIQQQMLATPNFNAAGISFPNQLGSQTNLQVSPTKRLLFYYVKINRHLITLRIVSAHNA